MRVKKRFIAFALLAILILCLAYFGFGYGNPKMASAETIAVESAEEIVENPTDTVPTETESEDSNVEEEPTFWTRIGEWFSKNFLEFLSSVDLVAVAGCIVAVILERKSNKKHNEETKAAISANTSAVSGNTASNDEVLRVANLLIDSTNSLMASEDNRDEYIQQLLLLNRAILEILAAVYVNSKNIPQATKDYVNIKYVATLKGNKSEKPDEAKEESEG